MMLALGTFLGWAMPCFVWLVSKQALYVDGLRRGVFVWLVRDTVEHGCRLE